MQLGAMAVDPPRRISDALHERRPPTWTLHDQHLRFADAPIPEIAEAADQDDRESVGVALWKSVGGNTERGYP